MAAEPVIHHILIILTEIPPCLFALLTFKELIIFKMPLLSNLIEVSLFAELEVILSSSLLLFTEVFVSPLFFLLIFFHPRRIFIIKSNKLVWNKIWKYVNNSFIENIYLLVNIFIRKHKLLINLVYCSSYNIYINSFKIPNEALIWRRVFNLKIKFAICWWWQFSCRVIINIFNYNDHQPKNDFLDSLASNSIIPYILHPTTITRHSKTLIDNIFSNYISHEIISRNITATISDHLPQFLICY